MNPTSSKSPAKISVLKILNGPHKGKQFRLLGDSILIGTGNDCDVILKNNKKCSHRHAVIKAVGESRTIETLNSENPVSVNKKSVTVHTLSPGDKITVGDIIFQFENRALTPANRSQPAEGRKKGKKIPPARILSIGAVALILGIVLMPSEETKKENESRLTVKTEKEIEDEVTALQKLTEEEREEKNLPPEEMEARVAFIKGFRDYRKGYYHRALKAFEHCVTLSRKYEICQSYVRQAQTQVNRMIQKKMLLGKNYKQNKQYSACKAAFYSVEIMLRDKTGPIYKEALENRKICELKTKNRL